MEFLKKNIRTIIGFVTGVILASSITVYAYSYLASDISYTKDGTKVSVEEALNDLYANQNKSRILETGTYTIDQISKGTEKQINVLLENDYTDRSNIYFIITSITQKSGELYLYTNRLNTLTTDTNGKWVFNDWIYNGSWATSTGSITFNYAVIEVI